MSTILLDSFSSGVDELPRKQQCDTAAVLRVLDKHKRFSVFEATANDTIARTMTHVFKRGYVRDIGGEFPWTNVEITDTGREVLKQGSPASTPATTETPCKKN